MAIKWDFPSTNGGATSGIADSGIETFNGTKIKSLAREICQNSIDASIDENKPAIVEFKLFDIPVNSIPDADDLKNALKKSKEYPDNDSVKAQKFFDRAIKALDNDKIICLRISDFNTTGLTGAKKQNKSAWINLTKAKGSSFKSGSKGGSFGIGKSATFACSSVRTVFYGTHDCEDTDAFQGVAVLPSFIDENGCVTQGMGFYGENKGNKPVLIQRSLDPDFERSENGTDVYILGFLNEENWAAKMIASVLDGFLYAIYLGKLIVKVDDVEICKDTLSEVIGKYKDNCEEKADKYYQALIAESQDGAVFEENILEMGKVTLYIMLQQDMHRKVAMVRKTGMKIMDKDRLSSLIKFCGLMYIEGEELNEFLRSVENPQHTKWEIDRTEDPENAQKLRKVETALRKFILDSLDKLKDDSSGDEVNPTVGEYLTAEREDDAPEERTENLNDDIKEFTKKEVKVRKPKDDDIILPGGNDKSVDNENGDDVENDVPGTGGRQGNGTPNHGNGGGGRGQGNGVGPHPTQHKKSKAGIASSKVRIMSAGTSKGEYIIALTPSVSAKECSLAVFLSAESDRYNANLLGAEDIISKNKLLTHGNIIDGLTFNEGETIKIKVKIDYSDYCSMEVQAYGHQV